MSFDAPEGVELERIEPHQTLSQMLLDGEIDALSGPRAYDLTNSFEFRRWGISVPELGTKT